MTRLGPAFLGKKGSIEPQDTGPATRLDRGALTGMEAPFLAWQRSVGNQAVTQRLAGGQPLEPGVRTEMEGLFDADLSAVRVFTDRAAASAAGMALAKAYTTGSDIVFGSGRYAPSTVDGRRLLAHELAHVLQQSRGPGGAGTQAACEAEADGAASHAASKAQAHTSLAAPTAMQRAPMTREEARQRMEELQAEINSTDFPDYSKEKKDQILGEIAQIMQFLRFGGVAPERRARRRPSPAEILERAGATLEQDPRSGHSTGGERPRSRAPEAQFFERPKPATALLVALTGTSLRKAIAIMHKPSEAAVRQFIDDYIRETANRPDTKRLHDDAVADRDALFMESLQREAEAEAARIDFEIGKMKAGDTAARLKSQVPYPLQMRAVAMEGLKVETEMALAAAGVVGMFIPVLREVILALAALEVIVGRRLNPFPGPIQVIQNIASGEHPGAGTISQLGDEIPIDERIMNGLFLAVTNARVIMRAGVAGRQALATYAAQRGLPPQQIAEATVRLAAAEPHMAGVRQALALARAGRPLTEAHLNAIRSTKLALGGSAEASSPSGVAPPEAVSGRQSAAGRSRASFGATIKRGVAMGRLMLGTEEGAGLRFGGRTGSPGSKPVPALVVDAPPGAEAGPGSRGGASARPGSRAADLPAPSAAGPPAKAPAPLPPAAPSPGTSAAASTSTSGGSIQGYVAPSSPAAAAAAAEPAAPSSPPAAPSAPAPDASLQQGAADASAPVPAPTAPAPTPTPQGPRTPAQAAQEYANRFAGRLVDRNNALEGIFRRVRNPTARVDARAAAHELRQIDKILQEGTFDGRPVAQVEVVPSSSAGRTSDLVIHFADGTVLHTRLEARAITGAPRGHVQPKPPAPGHAPSRGATARALAEHAAKQSVTPSTVAQALIAKAVRGQLRAPMTSPNAPGGTVAPGGTLALDITHGPVDAATIDAGVQQAAGRLTPDIQRIEIGYPSSPGQAARPVLRYVRQGNTYVRQP